MSWQVKRLEEIASFNLGKMLDDKKNKGDPLPYLANINVRWGEFELNDLRLMRFETSELERFSLKYGDIVMCEGGEPGRCAIWKEQLPKMMYQKALHRIRPHEGIDNQFLYYAFLHKGKRGGFSPLFTGSTIKHLPKEKLAKVEVEIPELLEQQRIATLLSKYDDLIENNKRRIELLEESARQLYKEWFVRFRFPGHEHVKIIDGVPDGWSRKPLKELLTLNYGKALKAEDRISGNFPVYGSSGVIGTHIKPLVKGPGIIVGRKGNVGSIFWSHLDFFPIDTVYFVSADESNYFVYCALLHTAFISTDVAVPGLNRDFAYSREIIVPTDTLVSEFEEEVTPVFKQCDVLSRYNDQLMQARNLLLPKLMSGEIAV